ncbi:MAG: hypothetical protein RL660_713 [Bacteroidota bacterium]|jgi:type I restriction-modification system DNA methylase subunit
MALFQTSVLNKYLAAQQQEVLVAQYNVFRAYFHNTTIQANILAQKEEQFQEGFLRELFVKVLGYTINPEPNFNLTTELKNIKDAKKADGAIIDNEKVLAVIELKGTDTTNLTKIELQAFGYKNNQEACRYVITSNFQKLRFYIDNAIEYQEWDLFKLDAEQFSLLYLCLAQPNIFADLPATIKSESVSVEENVTKQLYKEYSQFRKNLFNNIVTLNPTIDKLLVFKKTQKLLDRFLFLFFAEDRQLVPPNSVRLILDQWNNLKDLDAYVPLYDRFKLYFGYLNNGHKGKQHDIFAYNGGLFAPDEILDTITIDDSALYDATLALSNYDYNTEVDVNILGHIFEHSLTEIEELEKEITATAIAETKTSKRKKDGVFYTPKYITKYIVENTVGTLCKNKKEELQLQEEDYHKLTKKAKKELYNTLQTYKDWLLQITIIDPACGSGAFLNQALEFLIAEHRWLAELEANVTGASIVFDVETSILENNLFGVDINEESVEIAKLSLWLRTAQKGRKLNSLNNNIKCGNSLIDDPAVVGDKAFNWNNEFPHIFEKGGFDVVIGNPPYVNAKGENFRQQEKDFYYKNYQTAIYQIDTYLLFIEKANALLNRNRLASFIVPNAWMNNLLLEGIRKYILENFQLVEIVNTPIGVFADATVDTIIFNIATNKNRSDDVKISIVNNNTIEILQYTNQETFYNNDKYILDIFTNDLSRNLNIKIEENTIHLGKITDMAGGIKEYQNGKGKPKQTDRERLENRFNYDFKKDDTFLPHLTGSEFSNYLINWNRKYLSYGEWLAEPRQLKYFEGERLIIREIPSKKGLIVAYTNEIFTIKNSAHICKHLNDEYSLKFILALLNSTLMGYYFKFKFSEFDDVFPKAKIGQCKQLPIKITAIENQQPFINKAEIMLSKNKDLQQTNTHFQKLLTSKFPTLNINTKLEKWHELNFADFNKELTKQKVKLSLQDQSEWLTFFEQEKQKALAIKNEIDATDKEIDKMVYALYGLTEEEIRIVEGV